MMFRVRTPVLRISLRARSSCGWSRCIRRARPRVSAIVTTFSGTATAGLHNVAMRLLRIVQRTDRHRCPSGPAAWPAVSPTAQGWLAQPPGTSTPMPPSPNDRLPATAGGPVRPTARGLQPSSDVQAAEVGPYACWPLTTAVARSARDRHGRPLRRSLVSPRAPRRWAKRAGRQPGGTACWRPDAGVTAGRDGAGAAGSDRTFWRRAQGLRPDGVPGPVGSQLELDVVVGLAAPHRGHDLDVHQRHPGRGLPGARHLAGGIEHPAGVLVAAVGLIQDLQQVAGRLLR